MKKLDRINDLLNTRVKKAQHHRPSSAHPTVPLLSASTTASSASLTPTATSTPTPTFCSVSPTTRPTSPSSEDGSSDGQSVLAQTDSLTVSECASYGAIPQEKKSILQCPIQIPVEVLS